MWEAPNPAFCLHCAPSVWLQDREPPAEQRVARWARGQGPPAQAVRSCLYPKNMEKPGKGLMENELIILLFFETVTQLKETGRRRKIVGIPGGESQHRRAPPSCPRSHR